MVSCSVFQHFKCVLALALSCFYDCQGIVNQYSENKNDLRKLEGVLLEGEVPEYIRACARCRAELGRIINRGAVCKVCRHRVCKSCREYSTTSATEWLCTVCHKFVELQSESDWITNFVKCTSAKSFQEKRIAAVHSIKHTVQRSLTFSDASPSPWAALRGSPELRAYSSMPRQQDCDNSSSAFKKKNKRQQKCLNEELVKQQLSHFQEKENNIPTTVENNVKTSEEGAEVVNSIKIVDSCGLVLDIPTAIVSDASNSDGSKQTDGLENKTSISSMDQKTVKANERNTDSSLKNLLLDSSSNSHPEVALRKKLIDLRNLPPGVTPPRSRRYLHGVETRLKYLEEDITVNAFLDPCNHMLMQDSEDYRLVFISSSDSSSREELPSEDDKSSTSSMHPSLQLEDCDWDYFEASTSGKFIPESLIKSQNMLSENDLTDLDEMKLDLMKCHKFEYLKSTSNPRKPVSNQSKFTGTPSESSKKKLSGEGPSDTANTHGESVAQWHASERQPERGSDQPDGEGLKRQGHGLRRAGSEERYSVDGSTVAEHNTPSSDSYLADTSTSSHSFASTVSAGAVYPVVVPIPIPIPILVPIPWNPELTIRVEHALSPLLRSFIQQNWNEYFRHFPANNKSSINTNGASDVSVATVCENSVSNPACYVESSDSDKCLDNSQSAIKNAQKVGCASVQCSIEPSASITNNGIVADFNKSLESGIKNSNRDGVGNSISGSESVSVDSLRSSFGEIKIGDVLELPAVVCGFSKTDNRASSDLNQLDVSVTTESPAQTNDLNRELAAEPNHESENKLNSLEPVESSSLKLTNEDQALSAVTKIASSFQSTECTSTEQESVQDVPLSCMTVTRTDSSLLTTYDLFHKVVISAANNHTPGGNMELPDSCDEQLHCHGNSTLKQNINNTILSSETLPISELKSVDEILSNNAVSDILIDDLKLSEEDGCENIILKRYHIIDDVDCKYESINNDVCINNRINKKLNSELNLSASDSDQSNYEDDSVERIYNLSRDSNYQSSDPSCTSSEDSDSSKEDFPVRKKKRSTFKQLFILNDEKTKSNEDVTENNDNISINNCKQIMSSNQEIKLSSILDSKPDVDDSLNLSNPLKKDFSLVSESDLSAVTELSQDSLNQETKVASLLFKTPAQVFEGNEPNCDDNRLSSKHEELEDSIETLALSEQSNCPREVNDFLNSSKNAILLTSMTTDENFVDTIGIKSAGPYQVSTETKSEAFCFTEDSKSKQVTSSSSSDEFSGTESMELIPTEETKLEKREPEIVLKVASTAGNISDEEMIPKSIGNSKSEEEPKNWELYKIMEERGCTELNDEESRDEVRPGDPISPTLVHMEGNTGESSQVESSGRFTSLIMITDEHINNADSSTGDKISSVNIVTNNTTQFVQDNSSEPKTSGSQEFKLTLNTECNSEKLLSVSEKESAVISDEVKVITGGDTLSAVICLEEGLADDDSWVEEIDRNDIGCGDFYDEEDEDDDNFDHDFDDDDDDDDENIGLMKNISDFQGHSEEELRGYHRSAIDFTLHTILEESCEETSEADDSINNNKNDLEKYFFGIIASENNDSNLSHIMNINASTPVKNYDVNQEDVDLRDFDSVSETSSIFSEGLESFESIEQGNNVNNNISKDNEEKSVDAADLASSRLEKYFLMSLMGSRRDSDGSVGSDSEGKPSPEQRRKKLVRARGTGRSYSNSLDNLTESEQQVEMLLDSESSSSETDMEELSFDKNDGFDTVKRTNKTVTKKKKSSVTTPNLELLELDENHPLSNDAIIDDDLKTKTQSQSDLFVLNADNRNKQQSRDSGFMGSCDDLLTNNSKEVESPSIVLEEDENKSTISETSNFSDKESKCSDSVPTDKAFLSNTSSSGTGLIRKDSFNNWSSDEETNIMMSKMKQFFKTMIAKQAPTANSTPNSKTPNLKVPKKPPQLLHFESELTRLMKTVPGIRDDQVKEIVEYLSSEDTWSDSYDSSDYTSSDLEVNSKKSALQQEITASCRQIINNFDNTNRQDDTDLVYQRLVASFNKIDNNSQNSDSSSSHSSPPLITKVMQHIGSRLVALMHEVSSNDSHESSPKIHRNYHRRKPTMTTSDDESIEEFNSLPRSKSHDPLSLDENRQETSDNERFSWRGSFESALMTSSDSRQRLSSTGCTDSASASALALAAKRRSAGDLQMKSCSREQLDRVRSCGSIGGSVEDKIWNLKQSSNKKRRSSVPETNTPSGESADDDDSDEEPTPCAKSTTLPRIMQTSCTAGTNSLPRLPTSPSSASPSIYKSHSVHQFCVKSARYRPPGYNVRNSNSVVAPPRRDAARRRMQQSASSSTLSSPSIVGDDVSMCSELTSRLSGEEDLSPRTSLGPRSDSMASVYSGAGESRYGSVAVKGEVEFGLLYNYKAGALEIHVKQCHDLAAVDTKRNRSDPYVKVYLLPDKSKAGKRKTKVKKHTLNPVFEEVLKYHISLEDLESRTLWLSVWHSDMFGRNDFLGEVMMSLENKVFDDPLPRFYSLQERSEPLEDSIGTKGEIIVGLKFVPPDQANKKRTSKGTLHVLVKEAKNLVAVKNNGSSDPFCKSYLLPDKGKSSKQKTPVVRRSCSPAWNHSFTYSGVTLSDLMDRALELTVWDHDRLASNEFLGGVRLSLGSGKYNGRVVDWMDSNGKESTLWQQMLERPNFWVESCLSLRSSLDLRNSIS